MFSVLKVARRATLTIILATAFFSLLIVINAIGQTAPEKTPSATVVTNVDEVSLDMVVRDKKNKPVLDLKPQDLAVTDSGNPVKISDLRLVTGNSGSDRLLSMVFDRMDSAVANNARGIADKILKTIPQSGFSIGVLNIQGRLKLYQEFTADRGALTKTIDLATEAASGGQSAGAEAAEKKLIALVKTGTDESGAKVSEERRAISRVMLSALEDSQRIEQEQHTSAALAALLALSRSQQRIRGRKVVIYFTQGLHLDAGGEQMLPTISAAANRAGVVFYTIDVNMLNEQVAQGLLATMAMGNAMSLGTVRVVAPQAPTGPQPPPLMDLTTPGMKTMISQQMNRLELHEGKGGGGPLADLAEETGGAYIPAGENPRKQIKKLIEDMTSYYEVSYVPPIKEYDGQFRAVSVTAPPRPKLRIRANAGYFALPPDNGSGIRPFETPILKMLQEPQLPSDLKLQSAVLHIGELTGGNTNTLIVEVPVSELETRDDPNTNLYLMHASIVAQIKNKAGEVIEHFSEDIPRHGALDAKEAGRVDLITMQRHFVADPGDYTLETAVLDRISGKFGGARSSFVIPGPTSGPALSDLALVERTTPFPEETDPSEPMRYGKSKIVPDIAGRVPRGTKEISFFSIIHPSSQSNEPARLEMTVLRNGEALAQVPLQLRKTTEDGTVPYMTSIQSGALPAGDYQVIETLTQGEQVAERSVAFRIEGPELASANTVGAISNPAHAENGDIEIAATSKVPSETGDAHRLVITSLPPGSIPPPSADELESIVAAARRHATGYSKSLPNFVCLEVTNRSVDPSSNGNWKHRDTLAELLRYVDNQETRTLLERNGEKTTMQRSDLDQTWAISTGEFGPLLKLVFSDASKADFEWKEAASIGSETVQILTYRVARQKGTISLNDGNRTFGAGFHGLVYIDKSTGGVRRITLQADDLPRDFSIHAASMSVDYDFVTIGAHDYLMPMRATMTLQRGRRQTDLNEIAFRNYRRYASQAKISFTP